MSESTSEGSVSGSEGAEQRVQEKENIRTSLATLLEGGRKRDFKYMRNKYIERGILTTKETKDIPRVADLINNKLTKAAGDLDDIKDILFFIREYELFQPETEAIFFGKGTSQYLQKKAVGGIVLWSEYSPLVEFLAEFNVSRVQVDTLLRALHLTWEHTR